MSGIATENAHQKNDAECAPDPCRQEIGQGNRRFHFFPGLRVGNLMNGRLDMSRSAGKGGMVQVGHGCQR